MSNQPNLQSSVPVVNTMVATKVVRVVRMGARQIQNSMNRIREYEDLKRVLSEKLKGQDPAAMIRDQRD